ncbi:MAG: archease [Candidatus Rokuibacteriota bacterium]
MNEGFEPFSSGSEVGVRARGSSLAEAFARATVGMFSLIVEPDHVQERDVREVRAHAGSLERLLVNWLNECLYVHEVEGFVACRVEMSPVEPLPRPGGEPFRIHGLLHGEEVDPARHVVKLGLRAASPDGAEVVVDEGATEARVLFET